MPDTPAGAEEQSEQIPWASDVLAALLDAAFELPASELAQLAPLAGRALGGARARLLVADYAFSWLCELRLDGTVGERCAVEGTLPGRAFVTGDIVVADQEGTRVMVPISEGSERLGVLDLDHDNWSDVPADLLAAVVRALVLALISNRRYTDTFLRARRIKPLAIEAEMQWDLLPPLTCATDQVSVSGILEPAYAIGGDSFDYAINRDRLDFCIVDAVGHGMNAVMLSIAAINSLRNARREDSGLQTAYHQTDALIASQFGRSAFVTAQIGTLDLLSGELSWVNAGHPLPLLIRNGAFVGELSCRPSLPMGLGGELVQIAREALQPGDRVLFFTDGVTESRSVDRTAFGEERLADFLVRATLDRVSPAETVRRLRTSVMDHNETDLNDDATMILIDYHGAQTSS